MSVMISVQRAIIWGIAILILGGAIGFGFRGPIGSALNLNAQGETANFYLIFGQGKDKCKPPKIWTGNGCADTSSWTVADWRYFWNCLQNGQSQEVCAGKTEAGKGRR